MLCALLFGAPLSAAQTAAELKIAALPTGESWKNGCGLATENSRFVFMLEGHEPAIVTISKDARFSLPPGEMVKITIYLNEEEFDAFTYTAGGSQPNCLVYNPIQGEWVWWGASGACKSPF
jgi:hypothetical protein